MTHYTLTVQIDRRWVQEFNQNDFRLCVARGVNSFNKTNFNVIAEASRVAPNVQFSWADEYSIAATNSMMSSGAQIMASTQQDTIQYGEAFTLSRDGFSTTVEPNSGAPHNGFLFINQSGPAACILYQNFQGQPTPIYTSAAGLLPPGQEALEATQQVNLWFQSGDAEPGTSVSDEYKSNNIVVDFVNKTSQTVQYTAQGSWVIQS